jgi:hypothetical protein
MDLNQSEFVNFESLYPKEGRIPHLKHNSYLYGEAPPHRIIKTDIQTHQASPQSPDAPDLNLSQLELENRDQNIQLDDSPEKKEGA